MTASKRIGLVEQTGRGVDKIYLGQVINGRPEPDYSETTGDAVRLILSTSDRGKDYREEVYQREQRGETFTLDQLRVLSLLYNLGPLRTEQVSRHLHLSVAKLQPHLAALATIGLIRKRYKEGQIIYRLHLEQSVALRAATENRQRHDIDVARDKILRHLKKQGSINRSEAVKIGRVTERQATHLLKQLSIQHSEIELQGERRWARYYWRKR